MRRKFLVTLGLGLLVVVSIGCAVLLGAFTLNKGASQAASKGGPTYSPLADTKIVGESRDWTDMGDYNYVKAVHLSVQNHMITCLLVNTEDEGYGANVSLSCPTALDPTG